MMHRTLRIRSAAGRSALILCLAAGLAGAADWPNSGGNSGRNGQTAELGPDGPDLLWTGGRTSIIAWQPVIEGARAFMVRQTGFPPEPNSDESPVVAVDLDTGAELWAENIPAAPGDWTTWIAGARDGRVYAARSGNGASVSAKMYALDAATGDILWDSDEPTTAGAYDGVVFAPDGDLIVGSFRNIWRINAQDGTTAWNADRLCSVSGNCGVAVHGDAVYAADAVPGGHAIKRFDLATGGFQYQSSLMPGFTVQSTPMVGPDGTIYFNRAQNNSEVDYFYAFEDTGAAIVEKWRVPAAYSAGGEFGVGPDGSVYTLMPGNEFVRLDPATGDVVNTAGVLAGFSKPRIAIDASGRVFLSNGSFSTGRLYAFSADLTPLWDVPVTNINIGGPAMGRDGTLVVCGVGADVRAYRTPRAGCPADFDGDGEPTVADFAAFRTAYLAGDTAADYNGNGSLDVGDFAAFRNAYLAGCP